MESSRNKGVPEGGIYARAKTESAESDRIAKVTKVLSGSGSGDTFGTSSDQLKTWASQLAKVSHYQGLLSVEYP